VKSAFEIAGRSVGKGRPCYVIAEAGVNHNCDLALGRRLVETAAAAGADGFFMEVHDDPVNAKSDKTTQVRPDVAEQIIKDILAIRAALPPI